MRHVRVWGALVALTSVSVGLALAGAGAAAALPGLPRQLASPAPSTAAELCAALAGLGSCLGGAWLGLVTALAAADHLRGHRPGPRSGVLRPRMVTALVGATLVCAGAQPAVASSTGTGDRAPLPLPVRPVSDPAPEAAARGATDASPPPGRTVPVRAGDTLWSIAAARLPAAADAGDVDRAWRRIYTHNRDSIGHDPDLLHPGTTLTVPDLGPAATTSPPRSNQP